MPINNFSVIDQFLEFEQGTFYKFELLVRNTDGSNPLFQEGYSNKNKNTLIKSWYIDSQEYYSRMKHEMITLADLTGARLYVTLDKKDNVKLVQSLVHNFTNTLVGITNGQTPSIKSISKNLASETSKVENSRKSSKTIMFDVDTKDIKVLDALTFYIRNNKQYPYILETKKGYHIFCYKKFNTDNWEQDIVEAFLKEYRKTTTVEDLEELTHLVKEYVSMKPNELGLVYHPMKEF